MLAAVPVVVVLVATAVVLAGFVVLARRLRRSSAGAAIGAAMAAYDEAMHPAAHATWVELRTQDEHAAVTPSPVDDLD